MAIRNRKKFLLQRTLVPLIFGFFISIIFSICAHLNFEPIQKLERNSIDFATRLFVAFNNLSLTHNALPDGVSPIVMIDIDLDTCALLAGLEKCQLERIGQQEVMNAIVKTIQTEKPIISIIDIFLDSETKIEWQNEKFAALSILTPMDIREGNSPKVDGFFDLKKTLCGKTNCGSVSYLPAQTIVQDGISRQYPLSMNIAEADSGQRSVSLALTKYETLAYAAAKSSRSEPLHTPRNMVPLINYTIPSFSELDSESYLAMNLKYRGNIQYFRGLNILDNNKSRFDLNIAENAILIFGSSEVSGGDIHNTPLGPMGGMEVLANSIRSFQIMEPTQPISIGHALKSKIAAVIGATIIIGLGQFFLISAEIRREKWQAAGNKTTLSKALWDRYSAIVLMIMLAIFTFELIFLFINILNQVQNSTAPSSRVDVIWPVIGVLFSTSIRFSVKVLSKIEWVVIKGIELL